MRFGTTAARVSSAAAGPGEMTLRDVVCELEELITAIDRRVPRVQQTGEMAIARDAATLRAKAIARLEELKGGTRTKAK